MENYYNYTNKKRIIIPLSTWNNRGRRESGIDIQQHGNKAYSVISKHSNSSKSVSEVSYMCMCGEFEYLLNQLIDTTSLSFT